MPTFVLVDRLLDNIGGHNFQYAVDVLQAAERARYQVVLAARQEFQSEGLLPDNWQVRPVFRYGWSRSNLAGVDGKSRYPIDTSGRALPNLPAAPVRDLVRGFSDIIKRRRRDEHLEDFATGCAQVLDEFGLDRNNCIFVPTASEFDLLGLVRFLKRTPETVNCDWHLQFHFDIFDGREPSYGSQKSRCSLLRHQFAAALEQIPQHRLHFYATTPRVARQYNVLDVVNFEPLPYPVSGQFLQRRTSKRRFAQPPLRMTCAGVMRREKGKRALRSVLDSLSTHLLEKELQLWIQAKPKSIKRFLGADWARRVQFHDDLPANSDAPIVGIQKPLGRDPYIELIRRTDIGLFLYGSDRYHARCSGILVEMLAAGKPVIVPAGCWLADQIQDPIDDHLERLCRRRSAIWDLQAMSAAQLGWKDGGTCATARLPMAPGSRTVVCTFGFGAQPGAGQYIQVSASALGAGQPTGPAQMAILGHGSQERAWSTMFRVSPHSDALVLDIQIAYERTRLDLQKVELRCFRDSLPMGQVGLVCANASQAPSLVREIQHHYTHYRTSAERFSAQWAYEHDARRTVEALLRNQRRTLVEAA